MASTITALAVLGLAVLPDGADAAVPNGWVAQATLPDDGASTFDPTKIVLTVQDYGYDAAGNLLSPGLGGPVRTIRGTAIVRKQWSNQAQRLNSASGGTRTVYFALSDFIYASSTISAATAEAGYYGDDAAGAIGGVTNGSAKAYAKPLFTWLNLQHVREAGANVYVEGYAAHRHARNGRQVACIKYQARDAQGSPNISAEVTAAATTLSTFASQLKPEVFSASIPQAALTNGDLCLVNAKVYPWIGDASAVLDLIAGGTNTSGALTTAHPQTPLRFVCDRTGGYGGNAAYVRAGASGGAVNSAATPFPTIAAAMTALATANGGKANAHADHSGSTIYLMDDGAGGAVAHTIAGSIATAAGMAFTDIKPDPAATGAVSLLMTASRDIPNRIRWFVNITHSAGNGFDQGAGAAATHMVAFENMTLDETSASVPINYRQPLCFWRNVTFSDPSWANPLAPWADNAMTKNVLVLGCTGNATGNVICYSYSLLANRFSRVNYEEMSVSARPSFPAQDGCIVANNLFLNIRDTNVRGVGRSKTIPAGFALIQNVFESARATNGGALWVVGADNDLIAFDNVLVMHNSFPATDITGRWNGAYADSQDSGTGGSAPGVQKNIHFRGNIFGHYNAKSDTFASGSQGGAATNTGRVGNWPVRYGVGAEGNVIAQDTQNLEAPSQDGAAWLGEWWNPSNRIGPYSIGYTDNKAGLGAAGGGTYTLTGSSNDAYGRVAAGTAALSFDLAGIVRRNDGSGAAGAYETTFNPPITGTGGGAIGSPGSTSSGAVAVSGAGGGALAEPGGAGSGGLTPVTGSGGGSIGTPGASGSGEVTVPPITETGAIVAAADRIIVLRPVPAGEVTDPALPRQSYRWAAPFDPADRAPYALDWSALLASSETIVQIDRIRMSAQGAALGLEVDTAAGRTPIISTDGLLTQIWFKCAAGYQDNAAFADAGVQIGVSLLIRTSTDPYQQFERTGVLIVRQQ